MPSTTTIPVASRVPSDHATKLRRIAARNDSTISRTVACLIADALDHNWAAELGDEAAR